MTFRIVGLPPEPFRHLFGKSEAELKRHGAQRIFATEGSGLPDRVELRDAEPGEALLLVNYTHQPADTPYRSSHAVFILEGAAAAVEIEDELPAALHSRLLSLRAFSRDHMMVDADVVEGANARELIERLLSDREVAYIQAHYARRGCYAARIERS